MDGVRSAQSMTGCEDGCQGGGRAVDWPQVQAGQQGHQITDGSRIAVAQRLAEHLR
jgi:hypothetical protein